MPSRFVVVGSGRCGTKYLSELLTAMGVSCTHESVFNADGVSEWGPDQRADSSWMATTMLDQVDVPVVLLVRHPLMVVRSWVEIGFFTHDLDNPTHGPLVKFAPEVYEFREPHDRALAMWLRLNRAALGRAELLVRLEHLGDAGVTRLGQWAGANPKLVHNAFRSVSRSNRQQDVRDRMGIRHDPGWDQHDSQLSADGRDLAELLGYDPEGVF